MRIGQAFVVIAAFVVLIGAGLDAGRYLAAGRAVDRAAHRGAAAALKGADPWGEVVRSLVLDGLDPENMALILDVGGQAETGECVQAVGVVYRPEGLVISSLEALLPQGAVDLRSVWSTGMDAEM